jgi:outer membrane translocation and assembly module TamA
VNLFEADLNLVVDTRDVQGATSSGAYVEVFGGVAPKFQNYGFFHHGFEATGYFDLYEKSRVLVLRAIVEGVEGDTSEIPFSELPRLGGANRLRGYPQDRFRDEKVALGTVEYHYPIHQFVAGALYIDVGRVAPSYTELFEREGWKAGFGAGFIVRSRDKVLFTFDVAYGDGVMFHFTTDPLRAFSNRDTEL